MWQARPSRPVSPDYPTPATPRLPLSTIMPRRCARPPGLPKVLRAQYFVSDPTAFPGIAMAWASRFGAQPLPFACIQAPPDMPAAGMALIADFWISTG